ANFRHLFLAGEITASTLNTLHNLHFYLDTMRRIRDAIAFGTFDEFRQTFHRTFSRRSLRQDPPASEVFDLKPTSVESRNSVESRSWRGFRNC
ncbi:MAG: hypothetical protein AABN34_29730, partial [Acidobacteriota bacterium]